MHMCVRWMLSIVGIQVCTRQLTTGYNTEWCKAILPSVLRTTLPVATLPKHPPRLQLVTIFLGANDAVLPDVNPHQYVPLPEYKQNLIEMVAQIKEHDHKTRVLLISPPPVDPGRWTGSRARIRDAPDRSVENTLKYRDACLEAGLASGTPVLDTWELFLGPDLICTPEKVKDILIDGLHLDSKGNRMLGEALLKTISKIWPDLDPEKIPSMVAWHDQIDKSKMPDTFFKFDRSTRNSSVVVMKPAMAEIH